MQGVQALFESASFARPFWKHSLQMAVHERCVLLRQWIVLSNPALFLGDAIPISLNQLVVASFGADEDIFAWDGDSNKSYSAASFFSSFYCSPEWQKPGLDFMVVWRACLLPKVRFFCWLVFHCRLPTKKFLLERGCPNIIDLKCSTCEYVELVDHALFHCEGSYKVWRQLSGLFGIQFIMLRSGYDFLISWRSYFKTSKVKGFIAALWFYISRAL